MKVGSSRFEVAGKSLRVPLCPPWLRNTFTTEDTEEHGENTLENTIDPRLKPCPPDSYSSYPFTLIFEKEITARPGVGTPIESAGRKVVKIRRFFNCGSTSLVPSGSERMR